MSADVFDDLCWSDAYFREWASVHVPCGNQDAVVKLWQEMSRDGMWAVLCKEEAAMHGKVIGFSLESN